MFRALAEFEADINRERTEESYRAATVAGKSWGRPSLFHHAVNVRAAQALLADPSITKREVAKRFGVSVTTIYRWFPHGDPSAYQGPAIQVLPSQERIRETLRPRLVKACWPRSRTPLGV